MGEIRVRITDELHARVRKAVGGASVNAFVREAVAEKLGRSELEMEVKEISDRLDRIELLLEHFAKERNAGR